MSTIEICAIIGIVLLAYGLAFQWRRANELEKRPTKEKLEKEELEKKAE